MVAPAATDIQISGAASTGSPLVGSTFTYTYQVKNSGPWGTYGGVTFIDRLPASLTLFNSSVTQAHVIAQDTGQQAEVTNPNPNGGCSALQNPDGTTDITCPLDDMTVGGQSNQATITLTVTASGAPQPIANTASVHFNPTVPQDDRNPANNSVTVNVISK
jgi:uncharacterized repeat protein (TIGR01451 family)